MRSNQPVLPLKLKNRAEKFDGGVATPQVVKDFVFYDGLAWGPWRQRASVAAYVGPWRPMAKPAIKTRCTLHSDRNDQKGKTVHQKGLLTSSKQATRIYGRVQRMPCRAECRARHATKISHLVCILLVTRCHQETAVPWREEGRGQQALQNPASPLQSD